MFRHKLNFLIILPTTSVYLNKLQIRILNSSVTVHVLLHMFIINANTSIMVNTLSQFSQSNLVRTAPGLPDGGINKSNLCLRLFNFVFYEVDREYTLIVSEFLFIISRILRTNCNNLIVKFVTSISAATGSLFFV